jgi:hypothetical protein
MWFINPGGTTDISVVDDVLAVLNEDVMPFFSSVEDLDGFLEYLQFGEDRTGKGGIWNIGNAGSFRRLYLTGFTALELQNWELASILLRRCHQIAISKSLNVAADVLECVKHAALLADKETCLS